MKHKAVLMDMDGSHDLVPLDDEVSHNYLPFVNTIAVRPAQQEL